MNSTTDPVGVALRDSRRLTGPNLLLDGPGAVIDVTIDGGAVAQAVAAWRDQARRALDAVGWSEERLAARVFDGGASLACSAPVDALYAATEVNEWAWAAAREVLEGRPEPDITSAEALRAEIDAERNPALVALRAAAERRGVSFLFDPDEVSVGSGRGSLTWRKTRVPAPGDVPWERVYDVPVALVTGSNGKTTTVRLIAAMAALSGRTTGFSSTDGLVIGGTPVESGDYSGPEGARKVLRHPDVEIAVLETARGGLLRRGLAVPRAAAAVVTNVAADHLGEFGVTDVGTIADVKLLVARSLPAGGPLVVNAEDDLLAARAAALAVRRTWFSLDRGHLLVQQHEAAGLDACFVDEHAMVLASGGRRDVVASIADVPLAVGGAARHNVANALAAIPAARALGLSLAWIGEGLRSFSGSAAANPGRANVYDLNGVRVLVDFAHNPHGHAALNAMAAGLPARRRLVILGQAGDRDDAAIRELARVAWDLRPDRVIIKEMRPYLRGRAAGEVPAMLADELRLAGAPDAAIARADSEWSAVRDALRWARPGDLLVLPVHAERNRVLELMDRLARERWTPGQEPPL